MKKRNYNLIAGLFVALAVFFTSCEGDDNASGDNALIISDDASIIKVTGIQEFTTVRAEIGYEYDDKVYCDIIAEAPYKNNGFTLELPRTLPAKYLKVFNNEFISDFYDTSTVTLSDNNANFCFSLSIRPYDNAVLFLASWNEHEEHYVDVEWIYADRDVSINGECRDRDEDSPIPLKMNMNLKKGWNVVYITQTYSDNYSISYTDKKPSGVTFRWYMNS